MRIYRKILVLIDCSPVDRAIIDHIGPLARQNEAEVHLLHVVHSHTLDQERTLRGQAEQGLAEHVARLRAQGVATEAVIRSGEPDKEILAEIEQGGYDLVGMATHGHRFLGDLLFGSVSDTLKHKVEVPILMVRG